MDVWCDRFEATLAEFELTCRPRLLVGVSGGADSVALFDLLWRWARGFDELDAPRLFVGHVHHGLRNVEADEDAAFVRDLAESRGVQCLVLRANVHAVAKERRLSPEAAARLVRYAAFRRWAKGRQLDGVLTAHHLDDQAETVLLRAIRGAGLKGLGGIPRSRLLFGAKRAEPATRVMRPLLGWRQSEIHDYVRTRGLVFRVDSTNSDREIPRNRIRHEVMPNLELAQPGAIESLARLGSIARADYADLVERATAALDVALIEERADGVLLDGVTLARFPDSVVREACLAAAGRVLAAHGLPHLPRSAWCGSVVEWLRGECTQTIRRHLSAGLELDMRYGRIWLRKRRQSKSRSPASVPLTPERSGLSWNGWRFRWQTFDRVGSFNACPADLRPLGESPGAGRLRSIEQLDAGVVTACGPLVVRARRPGDRFRPLGSPGRKRLKEFFRECGVPPAERDDVPLLVADNTILWVVGCRISHLARCRHETTRVVQMEAWEDGIR